MSKWRSDPAKLEQRAVAEAVRRYYAGRGFRVTSVQATPSGAVARFPEGGPSGLKKLPLSRASLQEIVEILSQKGD